MNAASTLDLTYGWQASIDDDDDGWLVVHLHPDGKLPSADELAVSLWKQIEEHHAFRVVVEFDDVDLLTSGLMGQLVRLHKRLAQRHGTLRLSGLRPVCLSALHICRLDEVLPIYATRENAIHGQRAPAGSR